MFKATEPIVLGHMSVPNGDDENHIHDKLRAQWEEFIKRHFDRYFSLEVRSPCDDARIRSVSARLYVQRWHYDCWCARHLIIMWASDLGTEILLPNGRVYQPNNGEVVCYFNPYAQHRAPMLPRDAARRPRWFARAYSIDGCV